MVAIPTRTLREGASRLLARQATTVTVVAQPDPAPATTTGATPMSAGAIAGIVLGTVAGLLLIWWVVSACTGNNARNQQTIAAPAVRERSPHGRRHSHGHGHYYVEESRPSRSRSRRRSGSAHVHAPARVYTAERSPRASYTGGRSPARVYPAQPGVYDYDDYDQRPRRSSRY